MINKQCWSRFVTCAGIVLELRRETPLSVITEFIQKGILTCISFNEGNEDRLETDTLFFESTI